MIDDDLILREDGKDDRLQNGRRGYYRVGGR